MMTKELIERIDKLLDRPQAHHESHLLDLLTECRAALAPVEDEEVKSAIADCQGDESSEWIVDLIERLASNVAMWEKAANYWKDNHDAKARRIEELEQI